MRFFHGANASRKDQASAVRDGNSAVTRLVRFTARILLWGCVLLLLIRGIASEFSSGPRMLTTTRGVTGTVSVPVPAHVTTGGPAGAVGRPAHPARSSEGK
jgi:hypothetical protein